MGKRGRNKAGRRAYLKRFSSEFINAGRINRDLAQYSNSQFSRGRYTSPPTMTYEDHKPKKQVSQMAPKDVVFTALKELWQTDFWQGKEEFNRIALLISETRNLWLFFSGTRWFFVGEYVKAIPEQGIQPHLQRSIVYPSKEFAMQVYKARRICWVEKVDLNIPLLDGPRNPG